jgi:hypothetical protein
MPSSFPKSSEITLSLMSFSFNRQIRELISS